MTGTVEPAKSDDEPAIRALEAEAVQWLRTIGSPQWQTSHRSQASAADERTLAQAISDGDVFVIRRDGEIVATITVDNYADLDFWTPEDKPDEALYLHRMVVRRDVAGQDLGGRLIDWAEGYAARLGKRWLRLDAWRTNTALHAYYERHGFHHVRTVSLPHRGSGALFQRDAPAGSARDQPCASPLLK